MRSLSTGRRWKLLLCLCGVVVIVAAAVVAAVFGARHAWTRARPPEVPRADITLLRAVVLFRHGDRYPEDTYPTDPYRLEQFFPEGRGGVTKEGKQHMHQLGRNLRARYSHFLHELYFQDELVMESTNVHRCLTSAQLVLAGLYPPTGPQVWSSHLLWQPIPVYIGEDKKIKAKFIPTCGKIRNYFENRLVSEEYKEVYENNKQLVLYVANHSHVNATLFDEFMLVFPTVLNQLQLGLQLPDWAAPIAEELIQFCLRLSFICVETHEQKRLLSGLFLEEVGQFLGGNQSTTKAKLYSVQDLFIYTLLYTLRPKEIYSVHFGCTMMLELHSANVNGSEQMEVKLLMSNNYTLGDMRSLNIPQCGSPCYLEAFLDMIQPLIPANWEEECFGEVTSEPPICVIPSTTARNESVQQM